MYMRKNSSENWSIPENYGGTSLLKSEETSAKITADDDYLGERSIPPEIRTPSNENTVEEKIYREESENSEESTEDTAAVLPKEEPNEGLSSSLFGMDSSDILLVVLAALLLKEGNGSDEIAVLLLLLLLR